MYGTLASLSLLFGGIALLLPVLKSRWQTDGANTDGAIRNVVWDSDVNLSSAIADVINGGVPTIIQNHGRKWRAFEKWQNEFYLQNHVHQFDNVKEGNKIFNEDPKRSLTPFLVQGQMHPPVVHDNMTVRQFFDSVDNGRHLYYLGALHEEFAPLATDMSMWQALTEPTSPPDDVLAYVWLASVGISVQLHYDLSHNFHAMVRGCKRFTFLPPKEHTNLYLYPNAHPAFRKSQVYWRQDSIDVRRFPQFANVDDALEVELGPGQMIYIPPLWFHSVSTHSCGEHNSSDEISSSTWVLSTNVWSASQEVRALDAALMAGFPDIIAPVADPAEKSTNSLQALAVLVEEIIFRVGALSSDATTRQRGIAELASDFVQQVLLPRFQPLGAAAGCISSDAALSFPVCGTQRSSSVRQRIIEEHQLDRYAMTIADTMLTEAPKWRTIEGHANKRASLDIIVSVFVEKVVEFSLGTPQTCAWWQTCF